MIDCLQVCRKVYTSYWGLHMGQWIEAWSVTLNDQWLNIRSNDIVHAPLILTLIVASNTSCPNSRADISATGSRPRHERWTTATAYNVKCVWGQSLMCEVWKRLCSVVYWDWCVRHCSLCWQRFADMAMICERNVGMETKVGNFRTIISEHLKTQPHHLQCIAARKQPSKCLLARRRYTFPEGICMSGGVQGRHLRGERGI